MSFNPAPVNLKGKNCLVNNAIGGIGGIIAEHFAALALFPYEIRVNANSPSVIDALFAKIESKELLQKKNDVGEAIPLGYMGTPRDVARIAIFLASEQSMYITAQTLSVDGGNVLR
ncbi:MULTISPECIES: SDR family oxidoreductase [unclassified Lentilitoribacter]|uniref:SDR family oxidoreductase n=1 Tax=unclassified Lentilitoribacter TaxID=2647570 RepID=UPI001FCEFC30|nr:SDR family oxidoreductase [Lentilitoribacter sp. Alg239-R112]